MAVASVMVVMVHTVLKANKEKVKNWSFLDLVVLLIFASIIFMIVLCMCVWCMHVYMFLVHLSEEARG